MSDDDFLKRTMQLAGFSRRAEAELAAVATLSTLCETLPPERSREVARELPEGLAQLLLRDAYEGPMSPDDFFARVLRRARIAPRFDRRRALAVLSVLAGWLSERALTRLRESLPEALARHVTLLN
jgi:uncharacterized protein (DUF2267 family)